MQSRGTNNPPFWVSNAMPETANTSGNTWLNLIWHKIVSPNSQSISFKYYFSAIQIGGTFTLAIPLHSIRWCHLQGLDSVIFNGNVLNVFLENLYSLLNLAVEILHAQTKDDIKYSNYLYTVKCNDIPSLLNSWSDFLVPRPYEHLRNKSNRSLNLGIASNWLVYNWLVYNCRINYTREG